MCIMIALICLAPGTVVHHNIDYADAKAFSRKMFLINSMTRDEICKALAQLRQTHKFTFLINCSFGFISFS